MNISSIRANIGMCLNTIKNQGINCLNATQQKVKALARNVFSVMANLAQCFSSCFRAKTLPARSKTLASRQGELVQQLEKMKTKVLADTQGMANLRSARFLVQIYHDKQVNKTEYIIQDSVLNSELLSQKLDLILNNIRSSVKLIDPSLDIVTSWNAVLKDKDNDFSYIRGEYNSSCRLDHHIHAFESRPIPHEELSHLSTRVGMGTSSIVNDNMEFVVPEPAGLFDAKNSQHPFVI